MHVSKVQEHLPGNVNNLSQGQIKGSVQYLHFQTSASPEDNSKIPQ